MEGLITISLTLSLVIVLLARIFIKKIDFLMVFSWALAIAWSFGFSLIDTQETYAAEESHLSAIVVFLCVILYSIFGSMVEFDQPIKAEDCFNCGCWFIALPMFIGSIVGGVFLDNNKAKIEKISDCKTYKEKYSIAYFCYYKENPGSTEDIVKFADKMNDDYFLYKVYESYTLIYENNKSLEDYDTFVNTLGLNRHGMIVIYKDNTYKVIYYVLIVVSICLIIATLYHYRRNEKIEKLMFDNRRLKAGIKY